MRLKHRTHPTGHQLMGHTFVTLEWRRWRRDGMLPFHPGAAVASYGSHTGPGRLFARGSHRAAGLTSLAAAGSIILSESFVVGRVRWRVGTCWPGSACGVSLPTRRNRRHDPVLETQVVVTGHTCAAGWPAPKRCLAWRGVRACEGEELRPRAARS